MAKKTKKKEPKKINKQKLISLMAENSGLHQTQTKKALDAFIEVLKEALAEGHALSLTNFGSFKAVKRKARMGRNLQTGKKMKIKAKTVPKFTPGKGLREAVRK